MFFVCLLIVLMVLIETRMNRLFFLIFYYLTTLCMETYKNLSEKNAWNQVALYVKLHYMSSCILRQVALWTLGQVTL